MISFILTLVIFFYWWLLSKIKNTDGGIHLAKTKAGLGLMEHINSKELKEIVLINGFTKDVNILPTI